MNSGSKLYWPDGRGWGPWLWAVLILTSTSLRSQPSAAWIEPPATNAVLGSSLTLCALAQGTGPFSYQWQKNGLNLPNQTNECLTLSPVGVSDGGSYRATVSNPAGALASEESLVLVTLNLLPGADRFVEAQVIAAPSNTVRGFSFGASREPEEPRHSDLSTSNSVWYVWTAPVSGIVTFDTRGSTFDTLLAVYTGADLMSLQPLVSDDDGGGFHTSQVSWNAQAGRAYRIAIDGITGETGMYVCRWKLESTPDQLPVWIQAPVGLTVLPAETATFEGLVKDAGPGLRFQWFRSGQRIDGATESRLVISNVQDSDLGAYTLSVTNSAGRGIVSTPVNLEIGPHPEVQSKDKVAELASGASPPAPALAGLLAGPSLGMFSLSAGTLINQRFSSLGTTDRCEPAHCGVPGGSSRWFQLIAESDGICILDTEGSGVDTVLAVYLQNFAICTNLYEPLVDCNHHAFAGCEDVLTHSSQTARGSRVSFQATAGRIYRAVVDTLGGNRTIAAHFNVRFHPDIAWPVRELRIAEAPGFSSEIWGSSLALQVAPELTSPGNRYQWSLNGRPIAGAIRERLLLPLLDYADAGRYAVTLQTTNQQLQLPGVVVAVVDPCLGSSFPTTPTSAGWVQLLGATPEPLALEAVDRMGPGTVWEKVGLIPSSKEPVLWNVSTGLTRFYRFSQSPR